MKIAIKDLKRGQLVFDHEDCYRAFADPILIDGVWQCETTTGGDYVYFLVDGDHDVWDNPELN